MSVPSLTRFKVCTKCGCTKPATTEYFHRNGPARFRADCKVCKVLRVKGYYLINREAIIRRGVAYHKGNPERMAYMAEYLPKYRERNRGQSTEQVRRFREQERSTPEGLARLRMMARVSQSKRRAAQTLAGGECTVEEIEQMYEDQEGLCCYCEAPLFGVYHADHMQPISKGGSSDWTNIAIACPQCNYRKNDKTVEQFLLTL